MRQQALCPRSRLIQKLDSGLTALQVPASGSLCLGSCRERVRNPRDVFLKASLPENARHISDVKSNATLGVGD